MIDGISSGRRPALRRLGTLGFAAAIAALVSIAAPAKAATINTYTFTQDGYSLGIAVNATVYGSFSGYVEPDGYMNLAGLTSFQLLANVHYISTDINTQNVGLPTIFSFNTLGGNSSFSLVVAMPPMGGGTDKLCIGGVTALACGVSGANGAYLSFGPVTTTSFPQLTLVSSTAVTPIPAPVLLFATALSGLGLIGARARRQQRAA